MFRHSRPLLATAALGSIAALLAPANAIGPDSNPPLELENCLTGEDVKATVSFENGLPVTAFDPAIDITDIKADGKGLGEDEDREDELEIVFKARTDDGAHDARAELPLPDADGAVRGSEGQFENKKDRFGDQLNDAKLKAFEVSAVLYAHDTAIPSRETEVLIAAWGGCVDDD